MPNRPDCLQALWPAPTGLHPDLRGRAGLPRAALRLGAALGPAALAVAVAVGAALAEPVTLTAADGVAVHGDFRVAGGGGSKGVVIVLFHQAGSNHHEYDPIAPVLNAAGFDTLAIDQRSGGTAFGAANATVAARGGSEADYTAAYPDMEAALAWASARSAERRAIVWGSSYSAALAFRLASDHPETVAAVLAFSPGEYFADPAYVRSAAAGVRAPVFVSSASDQGEEAEAARILAAVPAGGIQFRAAHANHGASALREDANPGGAGEIWQAVLAFLKPFG